MSMNIQMVCSHIHSKATGLGAKVMRLAGCLCLLTAMVACSGTAATGNNIAGTAQMPVMEYTIGPSDVLSISVRNHPDMNSTVTVRPDGMITFPLLGELYVVGNTPAGLQVSIAESLGTYINIHPSEVSIAVDAVNSYSVSVLGEVKSPGRFNFQSQATVLDALAQAGGLTEFASDRNIVILRPDRDGVKRIPFNYRDVTRARADASQYYVFPGDTVLVP
jgi:polysaccharide biosynthesis/export protein